MEVLMKKNLLKMFILTFVLVFVMSPSMSFANNSVEFVSPIEAKKAAIFHIIMDKNSERTQEPIEVLSGTKIKSLKPIKESPWRDKKVRIQEPIEVYATSDSLYSYLFKLTVDGKPAGFIEVSALKDEYPILSFTYEKSNMDSSVKEGIRAKNTRENIIHEKVVAISPSYFGLKQEFEDGSAEVTSVKESIYLSKEENKLKPKREINMNKEARQLWKDIDIIVGDIGDSSDGVTDNPDEYETGRCTGTWRDDVPDLRQVFSSLWTGPSGCSPTSAANIMKYWANHGYPELTQGLTDEQLLLQLRNAMGTNSNGATPVNNIKAGLQNFARNRGISTAEAYWIDPPTFRGNEGYKRNISMVGPNIISFTGQTYYGEHSVTGMGYIVYVQPDGPTTGHEYMMVHDNWGTTPVDVYIAYGRNYDGIYFDQFTPDPSIYNTD